MQKLREELEKYDNEIRASNSKIKEYQKEHLELSADNTDYAKDKKFFEDELKKLNKLNDSTALTAEQITARLNKEDPSVFRKLLQDLNMNGEEPIWEKKDMYDRVLNANSDQSLPGLQEEYKKLQKEKRDLAAELQRTQDLLKQQVDIDKENEDLDKVKIKQIQVLVETDKIMSKQHEQLLHKKYEEINRLKEQLKEMQPSALTKENLQRLGFDGNMQVREEDEMTDFTHATNESEVGIKENYLDLKLTEITFDERQVNSVLGLREYSPANVNTFMTVEFYINELKHTEVHHGYNPQFNTIFCFKNTVDDFFLNYLDKNSIKAEIFAVRGTSQKITEKIGQAELPLEILLKEGTQGY